MTKQRARRLLLEAADVIEKHGWCRSHYESHGRHCMLGALYTATGGRPVPLIALRALREAIGEGDLGGNLAIWNDDQKTRRPVLLALRSAAAALKAG